MIRQHSSTVQKHPKHCGFTTRNDSDKFFLSCSSSCFSLAGNFQFPCNRHFVSTLHFTHSLYHICGSRLKFNCAQNIFSFHLLFRAMSHDLRSTPSILSSISLSSTSPSFTFSGSRLITSRIHCPDSRDLRGDGFADPEPRTEYEQNKRRLMEHWDE